MIMRAVLGQKLLRYRKALGCMVQACAAPDLAEPVVDPL